MGSGKRSSLEEARRQGGVKETGVDVINNILQIEDDGLGLLPQGQEWGHVLEPDPADAGGVGLRRRGPPDLRVPQIHHARPVILPALHEHRKVDDHIVKIAIRGRVVAFSDEVGLVSSIQPFRNGSSHDLPTKGDP